MQKAKQYKQQESHDNQYNTTSAKLNNNTQSNTEKDKKNPLNIQLENLSNDVNNETDRSQSELTPAPRKPYINLKFAMKQSQPKPILKHPFEYVPTQGPTADQFQNHMKIVVSQNMKGSLEFVQLYPSSDMSAKNSSGSGTPSTSRNKKTNQVEIKET